MTNVHSIRPFAVESLFPVHNPRYDDESLWSLRQFKKPYTGLSCFFGWAEKIADQSTGQFLSGRRKIIKEHSSAFSILEWFTHASDLCVGIVKAKGAKSRLEKNKAIEKLFFSSVDFTKASIGFVECLETARLIDLSQLFPVLPNALKGISSIAGVILRASDLFRQCQKTKEHYQKVPLNNIAIHLKKDKDALWKVLALVRAIASYISAILSVIVFFFALKLSPYLMLSISTFTFAASLAAEMRASL